MRRHATTFIAVLALLLAAPAAAFAQEANQNFTAQLEPVPHDPSADGGSQTQGTAALTLDGNQLTVMVEVQGAAPNLPHAQHLHGELAVDFAGSCPTQDAQDREEADGLISTPEGIPDYGPVQVSLTTSGSTGADSVLAVDRFPVADADGNYTYQRTFEVSDEVVGQLDDMVVVVHGIDINDSGGYDMDAAGESPLDPSLPFEATIPAACGAIETAAPDAGPFPDVPADAWYAPFVQQLRDAGITVGTAEGNFEPHTTLTRAQVAAFIVRALQEEEPPVPDSQPFPDVPTDAWYAPYVAELAQMGIVEGTADGDFDPSQPVTRAELSAFIGRAMTDQVPAQPQQPPFPDVPADAWYAPWVAMLVEEGVVTGYPDGTFQPHQPVTRAEASKFLAESLVNGQS